MSNRISFETEFGFKVRFEAHKSVDENGVKQPTSYEVTTHSEKDGLEHTMWFDNARQLRSLWDALSYYLDKTGYLRNFEEPKFTTVEGDITVIITPGYPFDEIDETPECFDITINLYRDEQFRSGYFWMNTRSEFLFFAAVINEYLTEVVSARLN